MTDNRILSHGGDWAGFEQEYGKKPLDFSSNVSPLGVPERVQAAIRQAISAAALYPDPLCRSLRRAIAEAEGVPAAWCLCGNGSAGIIYRAVLAKRPRRVLLTAPTFGEYAAALRLVGAGITEYPLQEKTGFLIQPDFLDLITEEMDMIFLCEPNNPTGRTTPKTLLLEILERCRETKTLLVVDECFGGFLADPAAHSMKAQLETYENLLILRAFTKVYALAGVRLGYCLCRDGKLLDAMACSGPPWSVSILAQAAGEAALRETDYVQQVREMVSQERAKMAEALTELGFQVVPGEANYLLFSAPVPLLEPLRQRGILLRGCGNYQGLNDTWYRTAVRTPPENRTLLSALRDVIDEIKEDDR